MFRPFALIAALALVAACDGRRDLDGPPRPLGDFALGHNIVVAPNIVKGPVSRDATKEEWIAAVQKAVQTRFGRYDGDRLVNLGMSVEGYVLAQPGIPVVFSPKSVLILRVTAWDDAKGKKLNEEPYEVTVLEAISGETFIGSGLTQTAEQQMENLAINAAKEIENWLVRMNRTEKWFGPAKRRVRRVPADAPAAAPAETPAAPAAVPAETAAAVPAETAAATPAAARPAPARTRRAPLRTAPPVRDSAAAAR